MFFSFKILSNLSKYDVLSDSGELVDGGDLEAGDRVNESISVIDEGVDLDPNWVTSIRERHLLKPRLLKASSSSVSCSIHRVPRCLRRHNTNAYDPQIISIGPFHYDKREGQLKAMEEHKWRYLHDILLRKGEHCLELYLEAVKSLEAKARRCYSEEVELDSNRFVEMMVLDGCFIIEFLRRGQKLCRDDPIFKLGWLRNSITIDLLRMENQIPFFVLEILCHEMGIPMLSFMTWIISFFGSSSTSMCLETSRIQHLLQLLHCPKLPPSVDKRHTDTVRMLKAIPNASRLREAGIKFKKSLGSDVLDIEFEKGVLYVPPLKVKNFTDSIFLNLVAFEQCYRHCNPYLGGYMHFMDCLIHDAKDVEILYGCGIIDCRLSSDQEVADLINMIGGEIIVHCHDSHLQNVFSKINEYCGSPCHSWRASLMRNYFNNPWATMSVLAALLLLIFTFTQTFFTAFPKLAYGDRN